MTAVAGSRSIGHDQTARLHVLQRHARLELIDLLLQSEIMTAGPMKWCLKCCLAHKD